MAQKLLSESNIGTDDIERRCNQLASNWLDLKTLAFERGKKLDESLAYQNWCTAIEEELAWINEKQHVISTSECGHTLPAAQGLIKKHDAFETDFNVHRERLNEIIKQGENLIAQGNHHSPIVAESLESSRDLVERLADSAAVRKQKLQENWQMLQFFWKGRI